MFQAGVPEKIIKERTGHHSLEALQTYERTTTEQHQAISDILSAEKKIKFQQALHSKQSILQQHSIPIHIQHMAPCQTYHNSTFNFNNSDTTKTKQREY